MPRSGKKGFRGYGRAGVKPTQKKSAPRRRLQPGVGAMVAGGLVAAGGKKLWNRIKAGNKRRAIQAKSAFDSRVSQSDNIQTASACVIGKAKPLSFEEKVARVTQPPFIFKRNYAFSSEVSSGRKGWFFMKVNDLTLNADLAQDISSYKSAIFTNTANPNPTIAGNAFDDGFQAYVDYYSDKIQMVNSSSNSVTGKMHLIRCKRDMDGTYATTTTPLNPVTMMMYYSTFRLSTQASNFEATVGNGWKFDTTTAGVNYLANYNSPGSSLNTGGATAQTDPALGLFSSHIKDGMDFWFSIADTTSFSLKPGQQINKSERHE